LNVSFDLIYVLLLVIYLEGILSIDNAAVLGAMVSGLPVEEPIPWPRFLRFLSAPLRFLGSQRSAALKVGLLGAYLGRGLMLFFANLVIHNPWLKILGGLYLIKLAFENLGQEEEEQQHAKQSRIARLSFWHVVLGVELADLAFSIDNVVAVVAISDDFWLVLFGVAIGILTMRFAASVFTRLIAREPILEPAAYIIVLTIGVELLVEEVFKIQVSEVATFIISTGTLILAVIYAHSTRLQILRPGITWLGARMAHVNEGLDWMLKPLGWAARVAARGITALIPFAEITSPKSASESETILD